MGHPSCRIGGFFLCMKSTSRLIYTVSASRISYISSGNFQSDFPSDTVNTFHHKFFLFTVFDCSYWDQVDFFKLKSVKNLMTPFVENFFTVEFL